MSDLIARDAAIAAIETARQASALPDDVPGSRMVNAGFAAARGALEKVPPASEWVSVNDRLPDKEGGHLCYYPHNGNITIRHCYENDAEGFAASGFTHWMELPTPPVG